MIEIILLKTALVFSVIVGVVIGFITLIGAVALLVSIPYWLDKKIPYGFAVGVFLILFFLSFGLAISSHFSGQEIGLMGM